MGKVKMIASKFETASRVVKNKHGVRAADTCRFVLWQMNPGMWYVELAVGGSKVYVGCSGNLVWRHTPRLGAHTTKGPVRPLRCALQVNPIADSLILFYNNMMFLSRSLGHLRCCFILFASKVLVLNR